MTEWASPPSPDGVDLSGFVPEYLSTHVRSVDVFQFYIRKLGQAWDYRKPTPIGQFNIT